MNKFLGIISLFSIIMMGNAVSFADPSVTGSTGTWSHKSTVRISGGSFGEKSPAYPLLWIDGEDKTVNSPSVAAQDFREVMPSAGQDLSSGDAFALQYRTGWDGVSQAHNRSRVYLAGGHHMDCGGGGCNNVGLTVDSGGRQNTWFVMYYLRLHEDWTEMGSGPLDNYKEMWFNDGSGLIGGSSANVSYFGGGEVYSGASFASLGLSRFPCGNQFEVDLPNPVNGWRHREFILNRSPGIIGLYSDYDNATWRGNQATCSDLGLSGDWQSMSLGPYARYKSDSSCFNCTHEGMKRYFDDLYMDNTLARVVLTNNANYNLATIIEPQIPVEWAGGSITVTVNLGKLPSSEAAYLFVFDSNNNRNATGFEVQIDGSGDGGEVVDNPSGLRVVGSSG